MTNPATPEPSEAMLRRVQLLLAKASDAAATPEESETYMGKATELMARYGIEQAMLDSKKPAGQRETVTSKRITIEGPYARQKQDLLGWLAKPLHCRAIWHNAGRGGTNAITLFGYPSAIALVETLYSSLLLQATRDMLNTTVPWDEHVAAYRRSFLQGFSVTVTARVTDKYRDVERDADVAAKAAGGPGTALVLVNRTQAVDQAVKDAYPRLANGRGSRLSGGGRYAGQRSGSRADIGGQRLGGQRTALGR